ncbi:MAG: type II toxin-antitoxin system Phd/YefM family antitoxin [Calditrichaeota bacterium]|nr:MAG: type II toxin-antitoxin system Phd/YefM family antitoxin [Calditrichota bacterium]MBL1207744.1 type II toxin-antitoxin system Phd/YefM family antitoxin [Calditrichota bacterium]NOG47578.1 type II toxin-antitoxin system Phd/YefM family antitoxin [Calditrichota bacterium]
MKLKNIKPVSYFKAHASEILKNVSDNQETYVITQNGEAKAVVQSIEDFEITQNTLNMLKLLSQREQEIKEGKTIPAKEAFKQIRNNIDQFREQNEK